MLEIRGGLDLLHEPVGPEDGGQLGLQDLDGHLAVVPEIGGEVDGGHTAFAELTLDGVAVLKRGCQPGEGFRHGRKI